MTATATPLPREVFHAPGDRTVVVAVGAHQIGQKFGVGGIGFGPRDMVAVAAEGVVVGGHPAELVTEASVEGQWRAVDATQLAALDRNYRPHSWDHLEAAHKKSGKTPEEGCL